MRRVRVLCFAAFYGIFALPGPADAQDGVVREEIPRLPALLTTIDGREIDVAGLAADKNLVLVTLKAPWCPVCQQQLFRLRERLPDLEACGVTFVVLSPGTPEQLAAIRDRTGFEFPFVADEGLRIARALGIQMGEDLILPCMLQILPNRAIGWKQLGRNGAYFGDRELREFFDCTRAV